MRACVSACLWLRMARNDWPQHGRYMQIMAIVFGFSTKWQRNSDSWVQVVAMFRERPRASVPHLHWDLARPV